MKWWGWILLGFVAAIGLVAVCGGFPKREQSFPVWDQFNSKTADSLGYKPVRFVKPGQIVPAKPVQGGLPIVAGVGYVVRPDTLPEWPDTLQVEASVIQDSDGNWWAGVWVAGQPVQWERLEAVKPHGNEPSDWSALIECTWVSDRVDIGIGAAWTPLAIAGAETGLAGTVDLNRVIDTTPDWIAVSGHLSKAWGDVRVGGQVGYRFGESAGLHFGVSLGVGLDL